MMQIGDWKEAERILNYTLGFSYSETGQGYLEMVDLAG